jgi:hypothetical protein
VRQKSKKMKKLFFAGAILLGSMGMYACGGDGTTATEENESGNVIYQDTTVSELEVERTVVETDTMTNTETIDIDNNQ